MARLTATGLNEEVLKRFKQLIIAKHGTLRGHMGEALTEAMRLWISMEENKVKKETS